MLALAFAICLVAWLAFACLVTWALGRKYYAAVRYREAMGFDRALISVLRRFSRAFDRQSLPTHLVGLAAPGAAGRRGLRALLPRRPAAPAGELRVVAGPEDHGLLVAAAAGRRAQGRRALLPGFGRVRGRRPLRARPARGAARLPRLLGRGALRRGVPSRVLFRAILAGRNPTLGRRASSSTAGTTTARASARAPRGAGRRCASTTRTTSTRRCRWRSSCASGTRACGS